MTVGRYRDIWSLLRAAADGSVRARLLLAGLAAMTAGALQALGPLALKYLVDALAAGDFGRIALVFAALYAATLGAGRLVEQGQAYAFATADQRLQRRFGQAGFDHLLRLPLSFLVERQTGALSQAHTLGLQGVRIVLTHAVFTLLPVLIQITVMATIVVQLFDTTLFLVVLVTMIAYATVFAWGVRRIEQPMRDALAAQVDAGGTFIDGLTNTEAVKAAVAEERVGARYDTLLGEVERRFRRCHVRRLEMGAAVGLVFLTSLGCVLWFGVSALTAGRISIGDFVLLNTYLLQVIRPLEMIGYAVRDLVQGANYVEKWIEILRVPPESRATPDEESDAIGRFPGCVPSICFENVSFAYAAGPSVLQGVDVDIPAGGVVAVVGPSGAGKSSLLRLLLRHYAPASGRILIDGRPIETFDIQALRGRIAQVSQDIVLFNDTLRYNLLFARPDADPEELREAITLARLDKLIERLPAGLDTRVGERGLRLSGGEKQRVAIARAVLQKAPVLVLDEATSALDPETEQAIGQDLLEALRGRTTLIVTHRLALAAHANVILVLSDGHVVERGSHADLLASGAQYARLWDMQIAAVPEDSNERKQSGGEGPHAAA